MDGQVDACILSVRLGLGSDTSLQDPVRPRACMSVVG